MVRTPQGLGTLKCIPIHIRLHYDIIQGMHPKTLISIYWPRREQANFILPCYRLLSLVTTICPFIKLQNGFEYGIKIFENKGSLLYFHYSGSEMIEPYWFLRQYASQCFPPCSHAGTRHIHVIDSRATIILYNKLRDPCSWQLSNPGGLQVFWTLGSESACEMLLSRK